MSTERAERLFLALGAADPALLERSGRRRRLDPPPVIPAAGRPRRGRQPACHGDPAPHRRRRRPPAPGGPSLRPIGGPEGVFDVRQ